MAHAACHAVYRGGGTIRCIVFTEGNVRLIGRHRHRRGQMAEVGKKTGTKKAGTKKTAAKKGDQSDVQGHTTTKKNVVKRGGHHMKSDQADVQGHVVARNTSRRAADPGHHAR
jgi:hypothetical protein